MRSRLCRLSLSSTGLSRTMNSAGSRLGTALATTGQRTFATATQSARAPSEASSSSSATPSEIVATVEPPVLRMNPILDNLFKPREPIQPPEPKPWGKESQRLGVIARKMGMMSLWDKWGRLVPCTVLRMEDCQVVMIKEMRKKNGHLCVQLGATNKKWKRANKSEMAHFNKAGMEPKQKVVEFPCSPDAVLPIGWTLTVRHFIPGQLVDVQGVTIGKGFQGPMKKWGFHGLPASHGVSLAHRSHGSTGQRQDPGRVFPGKKMAGRMGGRNKTVFNLLVYKIDAKRHLIYVNGAVPGGEGGHVMVRDAWKKRHSTTLPRPPFPTYIPKPGAEEPDELLLEPGTEDPFAYALQERE